MPRRVDPGQTGIFNPNSTFYPPWDWDFLEHDVPQVSQHELWTEMTARHEEQAKNKNKERSRYIMLEERRYYEEQRDKTLDEAMPSISEADEDAFALECRTAQMSVQKRAEQNVVLTKTFEYSRLLDENNVEPASDARLRFIRDQYRVYVHDPNAKKRPSFDDIINYDGEVEEMIKGFKKNLKADAGDLRAFMARLLYAEWITPESFFSDERNNTWSQYGACLIRQSQPEQNGSEGRSGKSKTDQWIDEHLEKIILRSGLNGKYVRERTEKYFAGEISGDCETLAKKKQWHDLTAKFQQDEQLLEDLLEGQATLMNPAITGLETTRKGQIQHFISLAKAKYFKELKSSTDFKVSKTALKMQVKEHAGLCRERIGRAIDNGHEKKKKEEKEK